MMAEAGKISSVSARMQRQERSGIGEYDSSRKEHMSERVTAVEIGRYQEAW
jgi:hypothetical protein